MKKWQQSYTGRAFTALDLKPEQVCIEDIAHALSTKCRFTGHSRALYSVAQHCVHGAALAPPHLQLAFLLHDATEAYLPDIGSPVKSAFHVATPRGAMPFRDLEAYNMGVILQALGLTSLRAAIDSPEVHEIDMRMLTTEARDMMGPPPEPWGLEYPPYHAILEAWEPSRAKAVYLEMFRELTR